MFVLICYFVDEGFVDAMQAPQRHLEQGYLCRRVRSVGPVGADGDSFVSAL